MEEINKMINTFMQEKVIKHYEDRARRVEEEQRSNAERRGTPQQNVWGSTTTYTHSGDTPF